MQERGFVYGQQKMIAQYNCTGDWAFYTLKEMKSIMKMIWRQIRESMIVTFG